MAFNNLISKIMNLELPETIKLIQLVLMIYQEHFFENNQDMLDKILELMETPQGTLYLQKNFSLLSYFLTVFKHRGQINSAKRLYYKMREIFNENYKKMDITHSLTFLAADYEYMEEFTETNHLVFDNIIEQSVNVEPESLLEIFEALGQIMIPEEKKWKLKYHGRVTEEPSRTFS